VSVSLPVRTERGTIGMLDDAGQPEKRRRRLLQVALVFLVGAGVSMAAVLGGRSPLWLAASTAASAAFSMLWPIATWMWDRRSTADDADRDGRRFS
jgi:hypothetical protein